MTKILLLTFLSFGFFKYARAQHWQEIATFPVHEASVYFLNENYGFVFTSGFHGPSSNIPTDVPRLWRTTDGGTNWTSLPTGIGGNIQIWELYFTSSAHGYMAIDGSGNGGLFETDDSGSHWNRLTMEDPVLRVQGFISVYAVDSELYAITAPQSKSGVALWHSLNSGYTWQEDSAVVRPEFISGNRERLLEASGPNNGWYLGINAKADSVIFVSSDAGENWSVHGGGAEQWNQFVLPHSGTIVCAAEQDSPGSAILVSTDRGVVWRSTYTSTIVNNPSLGAIDAVSGDGCSIYVQRSHGNPDSILGLLRSTDQGQTWTNVGGPLHGPDERSISVVGHGALVYALADYPTINSSTTIDYGDSCSLWKTTDGGDGTLSSQVPIQVTTGHTLGYGAAGADTLVTKLCDTASLALWLQFTASCDYGGLTGITIDGINSSTVGYRVESTRHPWSENLPDTSAVTIIPLKAGTYSLTVHAHYTDDDFLGGDTTFPITLVVQPNPGTLAFAPLQKIDFGAIGLCNPIHVEDSLAIRAGGCNPIIDSIIFQPDSVRFTDFIFSPVRNLAPSNNSTSYIPISFKPSIAHTEHGSILIFWSDGESSHMDTIRVQGAGLQDTRSFAIQSPAVTVRMCDTTLGTITVTNTTCGFLELDSLTLPAGLTLPLSANLTSQLPLDLKAGASDSLVVRISPGAEGGSTGLRVGDTVLTVSAHLKYTDNGGTTSFDTTITLLVHVERGIPQAVFSDTALNFGTVSACDSATLPLVISSAGCDTVSEIGYRVQGVGYRVFGNENPLPVGSSDTLYVTFSPSSPSGPLTDSLSITTNAGTETVPLHATAAPGASALSLSASDIDFGSLSSCEARDTTIYIKDSGCAALTLDSAVFSNPSYIADTSFPLIIPAADSVPVRISLISGISPNPGSVTFYSNANTGDSTARIPLVATIIQPLNLTLSLSPAGAAHAGQMVTIYVILTGDTGAAASELKGLQFVLTHNDDLLALQNASGLSWSLGSATITRTDTFAWSHGSRASAYTDTIGTLTFQVYLTDSSGTPLSLSDISFQGPPNLPLDCIASVDSNASAFQYLYHCGDLTIQQAMEHQPPFSIASVIPNPATASLRVQGIGFRVQGLNVQLFDALGNCVLTQHSALSTQHFETTLDVSELPSGIYFLRLSSGGYAESRSVAIQR